jgi:hypothetical protein
VGQGWLADQGECGDRIVSAAYGTRISSELPGGVLALNEADHWPSLDVVLEPDPQPLPFDYTFATAAGTVCLSKDLDRVRLPLRDRGEVDLAVHPLLSAAAWMRARLLGLEVLHAGAVLSRRGAWLVLGDKEAGKSTLLAQLHAEGLPVVADDLAILDAGCVYSGPRCLDLRPDMGRLLDIGRSVGGAERCRVDLPPVAAEHRVAGFVELRWSDRWGVTAVAQPGERLGRLLEVSGQRPRRDPLEMLELGTLPYYVVERPRHTNDTAARLLEDVFGDAVSAPAAGRR